METKNRKCPKSSWKVHAWDMISICFACRGVGGRGSNGSWSSKPADLAYSCPMWFSSRMLHAIMAVRKLSALRQAESAPYVTHSRQGKGGRLRRYIRATARALQAVASSYEPPETLSAKTLSSPTCPTTIALPSIFPCLCHLARIDLIFLAEGLRGLHNPNRYKVHLFHINFNKET